MSHYRAILSTLYNTPHLIHPEKLRSIAAFVESRQAGEVYEPEESNQPGCYALLADGSSEPLAFEGGQLAANESSAIAAGNGFVAVMPLFGTMFQHGGMEMRASGGTSTEQFGRQFASLAANPAVKSIVVEVHSPGGQVWGTQELSDQIYSARESGTRVISAVNSMAASAALWASTAASKVYVTPGGEMGSLGVVVMHEDYSQADEKAGIKTTLIATPEAKVEGHPYGPLSEEAEANIREEVNGTYAVFVDAVARNRGTTKAKAQSDFGGGRMLLAKDAVKAGLADGVMTMRDVLAKEVGRLRSFQNRGSSRKNSRAAEIAEQEIA